MSTVRAKCGECGCPAATKWSDRDWSCPACGSGLVLFGVPDDYHLTRVLPPSEGRP